MNILLIHQYFLEKNEAGGSRFNEMVRMWAEKGHKITVLAGMVHYATGKKAHRYKGKWIYVDKEFYPNVDVIRTHVSESYNTNFIGRLWAYFSFMLSSFWAGLFKTNKKFNVIVATSPPLFVGISAYLLSVIKRIPYIFEVRDLWPESAIDTRVLKNKMIIRLAFRAEKFIYRHASLINVLTPAFRDKLINDKNIPSQKIILYPNAADFALSESLMDKFDVEKFRKDQLINDKFVITYIGAHGIANHLIQLIEAAEQLQDTNVLFQLIGDGMEKKWLMEEVKRKNIKNVRFIDPIPKAEVFKYILSSDMGASILKKADTFKTIYSNKTFDYMSCKKPVLLAIDGVSRALIEKVQCGVYIEPENAYQMANEIRKLINAKEQLALMGENGYSYVKKHFDRKKIAIGYLNEIKSVVRNNIDS